MEKKKSWVIPTVLALVTIVLLSGCILCYTANNNVTASAEVEQAQPRGLMTQISLSMGTEGTTVWAKAHNDFTFGLSTIQVYVYLYSSLDYQEEIKYMQIESSNYIADLNINKSLKTTASIGDVERYWRARVKYKLDSNDWVIKETPTYKIDVNGNVLD